MSNESLNLLYTVGQLRALGVTVNGVPDAAEAGLYRMDGSGGLEYWVGLHNFYVITRYNHSSMYALAVHQLGQAIAGRAAEVALAEPARPSRLRQAGNGAGESMSVGAQSGWRRCVRLIVVAACSTTTPATSAVGRRRPDRPDAGPE